MNNKNDKQTLIMFWYVCHIETNMCLRNHLNIFLNYNISSQAVIFGMPEI